jgi:hypothetical protein
MRQEVLLKMATFMNPVQEIWIDMKNLSPVYF